MKSSKSTTKEKTLKEKTLPKKEEPKDLFVGKPFSYKKSPVLASQFARVFLVNQTQGTHKTKTKGEVSGGGRKPFKQKHTGRARQGSTRSPLHPKGGVSHGPVPHTKRLKMSFIQKRNALYQMLSEKKELNNLFLMENLETAKFSTKKANELLKQNNVKWGSLVILGRRENAKDNTIVFSSFRNIEGISFVWVGDLNANTVLNSKDLFFEKLALEQFYGKHNN